MRRNITTGAMIASPGRCAPPMPLRRTETPAIGRSVPATYSDAGFALIAAHVARQSAELHVLRAHVARLSDRLAARGEPPPGGSSATGARCA